MNFDTPALTWMPMPQHTQGCCDVDLENLTTSSLGANGYSLQI